MGIGLQCVYVYLCTCERYGVKEGREGGRGREKREREREWEFVYVRYLDHYLSSFTNLHVVNLISIIGVPPILG